MQKNKWKSLLIFILIVLGIQLLGYLATGVSSDNWYASLKKPDWTGSTWTFGWVWTALYILIAFSGWIVYERLEGNLNTTPMKIYGFLLFCSAIWPWLFFTMHNTVFAFVDIVVLLLLILFNIAYFWGVSPLASLLLLPYLIWISYAMSINFVIALYDMIGEKM